MSKKAWIIFAAICVLVLGLLVALSNSKKVNVSNIDTNKIQTANEQSGNIAEHVFGKADSKVMFTEYGDYQCPGCRGMYATVKSITEKYQGQLAFVFRNFPLKTIHPNAFTGAAAAEAAGLQGKYWQMHDLLYENQDAWKAAPIKDRVDAVAKYATQLNLDVNKFKTDLASENVAKKINYDLSLGQKINVSGTPTFILNGKEIDSKVWSDPAKLEAAIVDELKRQGIALPETVKQ